MTQQNMGALTIQFLDEWEGAHGFVQRTMPTPTLDEKERADDASAVIVKLRYAGVCGTDRGIWFRNVFGDAIKKSLEEERVSVRIIGHELFGEIVDAGSAALRDGWIVGDTVTAESHITCGTCYQCLRKEFHVCTQEKILGISYQGCFAEYIKLPAKVLWKTDLSRIRTELACLQEPFGNGVHAVTSVGVQEKNIAVLGCGPVGLYVILVARALGAKQIIAVDPLESQRKLALLYGASVALSPASDKTDSFDEELQRRIVENTDSVGADCIF
ncbi:MAG: alcohol dehydrogenase catalytic domain-containing protein, partial [bacterium]